MKIKALETHPEIKTDKSKNKNDSFCFSSSGVVHNGEDGSGQREDQRPRRCVGRSAGQTALVHVVSSGLVCHQVQELRLDQLAVEVSDGVLEGVLVALQALALVAACVEAATQNRHALREKNNSISNCVELGIFSIVPLSILGALVSIIDALPRCILVPHGLHISARRRKGFQDGYLRRKFCDRTCGCP